MLFITTKPQNALITQFFFGLRLLIYALFLSKGAIAETTSISEPIESIQLAAKIFLEENTNAADNTAIEVDIHNLDPRLRLRKCIDDLNVSLPRGSDFKGRVTVAVTCKSPIAWKVLVSANINEFAMVVVSKKAITKKALISGDDVVLKKINIAKLRKKPLLSLSQVVNTFSKRSIRADVLLYEDSVCMVCRGALVQISAKNPFININLEGIALKDASYGEITQVRNTQSKRLFNATVIGKNKLMVSLATTN